MMGSKVMTRSATLMLAMTVGMSAASADGGGFTLKTIEGSWGFSGDGVLAAPDPDDRLPIASIGVVTFDGEGGCEISAVNHLNGTAFPVDSEFCSYVVNPDGTGTSDASFPAAGPFPPSDVPVAFVIVDGAREIRFAQTAVIVSHFVGKPIESRHRRHRRR